MNSKILKVRNGVRLIETFLSDGEVIAERQYIVGKGPLSDPIYYEGPSLRAAEAAFASAVNS